MLIIIGVGLLWWHSSDAPDIPPRPVCPGGELVHPLILDSLLNTTTCYQLPDLSMSYEPLKIVPCRLQLTTRSDWTDEPAAMALSLLGHPDTFLQNVTLRVPEALAGLSIFAFNKFS